MAEASILLVEDNPQDVALMRRALLRAGVTARVDVVSDGVEALERLGVNPGPAAPELPKLMLLDLNLPRLDGHEVLRAVRAAAHTRRLPVVVLTSSVEQEDLEKSYDGGVNSYVRKPIVFEQFLDAVREIAAYWLQLNHGPPAVRASV